MMRRIYHSIPFLYKEQSGVAKILFALSMFMIIGFTALVVDVGSLYFEKSSLQKSLDAAVLGGAQRLKVSEPEAKAVAIDLAAKNGFTVTDGEVTTGDDFIEINKTVNKDLFFARIFGFHNTDVSAAARAELVQTLVEGDGVIPVGMEKKEYQKGGSYALNETPGNGYSGNYRFLAIDGKGAPILEDGIRNGTKKTVEVGKFVETEPGMNWGPVKVAFEDRIGKDSKNPNCAIYEKTDNTCYRVVILPIVDTFNNGNGRHDVKVVGFAAFWIESISQHETKGRFIDLVTGGTFGPGEDFGIYGVKLVK
jgi:hypothetical protein